LILPILVWKGGGKKFHEKKSEVIGSETNRTGENGNVLEVLGGGGRAARLFHVVRKRARERKRSL